MVKKAEIYNSAERGRRAFLRLSALGAGLSLAGGCGIFTQGRRSGFKPGHCGAINSDGTPLKFGFIGVGGAGREHLRRFTAIGVDILALCDVDQRELYAARDLVSNSSAPPRIYKDFRVMLASNPGLDAVVVSTPDHGHVMQAVHALRTGCNVFLETPLAHTLEELAVLERETKRAKRVLIPADIGGTHKTAHRAHALISSNVLGKISQVHIWSNRPLWPQGGEIPEESDPVPETLDWQLWLAGAKPRPYKQFVYHKFNWRGWNDFGSGTLGDVGCRLIGFPFKVLDLEAPRDVESMYNRGGSAASYPRSTQLRLRCRSRSCKNPVELFWYDGGRLPRAELLTQVRDTLGKVPGTGTLMVGERGSWLVTGVDCDQHYIGLNNAGRMTDFEKHELWSSASPSLPCRGSSEEIFLRAICGADRYDFESSARKALNQTVLIGAIAQRMDGTLQWNQRRERFQNNDAANALLKPHLEAGWEYF